MANRYLVLSLALASSLIGCKTSVETKAPDKQPAPVSREQVLVGCAEQALNNALPNATIRVTGIENFAKVSAALGMASDRSATVYIPRDGKPKVKEIIVFGSKGSAKGAGLVDTNVMLSADDPSKVIEPEFSTLTTGTTVTLNVPPGADSQTRNMVLNISKYLAACER
jgi:hypothetical protein